LHGSRPSRFRRFLGVALGAALWCASAARGEDADKAREHYGVGLRAFDLGKYDEAISEFEEAYRYKDAPGLLYNIAQAYRLSNRSEEALRYYRTYLERKPDAPNRAEAESKIDRLAAILEERKARIPAIVETAPSPIASSFAILPRTPALVVPAAAEGPRSAPVEAVAAKTPARFWTARRAGWVATGVGAAALAFAVYFGLEARSAAAHMENDAVAGHPFDAGVDAKGQRAQTLSRVMIASSAIGFGAAGLLWNAAARTPIEAAANARSEETAR
jgi:tetratricopeptide (TPR) repeat protein